MAEWWPRAHNLRILLFLRNFVTDFSEPKKAIKLKVGINMDNDWIYRVYLNMGKGTITHGVIPLVRFLFSNFAILENFHFKQISQNLRKLES